MGLLMHLLFSGCMYFGFLNLVSENIIGICISLELEGVLLVNGRISSQFIEPLRFCFSVGI